MSDLAVAAVLAATILVASTISVEIGLSVALIELFAGVVVGNAFHIDVPGWLSFVGNAAPAGVILIRYPSNARQSLSTAVVALVADHGDKLAGSFTVLQPGHARITSRPPPR